MALFGGLARRQQTTTSIVRPYEEVVADFSSLRTDFFPVTRQGVDIAAKYELIQRLVINYSDVQRQALASYLVGQLYYLFLSNPTWDSTILQGWINRIRNDYGLHEQTIQKIKTDIHHVLRQSEVVVSQPVAKPEPQPEVEKVEINPELPPLDQKGLLMAEIFSEAGKVEFQGACEKSPRCYKLLFKKPPRTRFDEYRKWQKEALSNAGLSPGQDISFIERESNLFEVQIPKPVEEWKPVYWLTLNPRASDGDLRVDVERIQKHLRRAPWDDPQVPIGINLDGKVSIINLSASAFAFGDSESGKSMLMKSILTGLIAAYPASLCQINLFDFKGGLTFSAFKSCPQIKEVVGYSEVGIEDNYRESTREYIAEVYQSIREEMARRARVLESHQMEKIQEYNRKFPEKAFPWIFNFWEEIRVAKDLMGDTFFKKDLKDNITQWRALGCIFVGDTQYPSAAESFEPATRSSMKTKLGFKCLDTGAALLFGKGSEAIKIIPNLVGSGDGYGSGIGRFQGFLIENEFLSRLLPILTEGQKSLAGASK